jgi:hypothetical protein
LKHSIILAAADRELRDDNAAVEGAREGLSEPIDFPWYDKQKDEVRRIDLAPPPPPPKAGDWEFEPSQSTPSTNQESAWQAGFKQLMWMVAIAVLILAVGAIVVFLILAFLRNEAAGGGDKQQAVVGTDDDVDRVEALPFDVRRPKGDLLSEARRHYEAGNYNEAIVFFYSYLLVQLDKNQLIRLTRGKTNRQYLREIRRQPLLHELLGRTMVAFEDVFFGHHQLPRSRFETCYHRLDEFEARIQEMVA